MSASEIWHESRTLQVQSASWVSKPAMIPALCAELLNYAVSPSATPVGEAWFETRPGLDSSR